MPKFLHKWRDRLPPKNFKPSVRLTLVALNMFILLLLILGLASISFRQSNFVRNEIVKEVSQSLDEKQKYNATAMLHCLSSNAAQAISEYHFYFLNELITHLVNENADLLYLMVVDNNGKVFAHNDPEVVGKVLKETIDQQLLEMLKKEFPIESPEGLHAEGVPDSRFVDLTNESGEVAHREAIYPIYVAGKKWGMLRGRLNLAGMTSEFVNVSQEWEDKIQAMRNRGLWVVGLVFLLGTIISTLVVQRLVKAIREMNIAVSRVAEGKLDGIITSPGTKFKEFSKLVDSFNLMTMRLKESYEQLDANSKELALKVKERTDELEEAQYELLQKAHKAGMAEMAVGILHNIGNAITPAKIGNMVLLRQLKKNTFTDDLLAAVGDIQVALEHPQEASEEEVKRLVAIAKLLPETIREVQASYCEEVEKIYDKLVHIESIIHLQMRYARLYEPCEDVLLGELVEDALKMLQESIMNRKIKVVRKLNKVPPAFIQKGKMMQIVINLIKNAYEAMGETFDAERVLEVETDVKEAYPGFVVLTIKDTGVGFLKENSENLFKYGYTTKSSGSGFGLHSCANFLIANKGEIEARSDGPGKGATFVVRIPTRDHFEQL